MSDNIKVSYNPVFKKRGKVLSPRTSADVIEYFRPFNNPSTTQTTVYVATTGNDTTGTGTALLPFLTINRAIQDIGITNPTHKYIECGAGEFELPTVVSNANYVNIQGALTTLTTRNISSVDVATENGMIVVTVDGDAIADDAYEGKLIKFVGAAPNGLYGHCYRNIGNVLYLTQEHQTAIQVPTTATDIVVYEYGTHLKYKSGGPTEVGLNAISSVQFNIRYCELDDYNGATHAGILAAYSTSKVDIAYCKVLGRYWSAGFAGGFYSTCSYIATYGYAINGMITFGRNALMQIGRGSVVDGVNASGSSLNYIVANPNAIVQYKGWTVFRNIDSIQLDGAIVTPAPTRREHDVWLFDNAVSAECAKAVVINSRGIGLRGSYELPNLVGAISGNYAVEAQLDARGSIGATSSLTTGGDVNGISADGGSTSSAQNVDGTYITGGTPTPSGFASVASGQTTLCITAAGGFPSVTSGCTGITQIESTTNDVNTPVMDFADGSTTYAEWVTNMPGNYNAGTITAILTWTANSASTNSVIWGVQALQIPNDGAWDTAYGTAVEVTDANQGTYDINITAATAAITVGGTPAANKPIQIRVYRKGGDAGDDLAATARLIMVTLTYTPS